MMARDRVRDDRRRGVVQIVLGDDGRGAAALHEQSGIHKRLACAAHVREGNGREQTARSILEELKVIDQDPPAPSLPSLVTQPLP